MLIWGVVLMLGGAGGILQATLHTEILIKAPPARVWALLEDLPGWSDWNSFIPQIATDDGGQPRVGGQLRFSVLVPVGQRCALSVRSRGRTRFEEQRAKRFEEQVVVTRLAAGRQFAWRGGVGKGAQGGCLPCGFSGEHIFELYPEGEGACRLLHYEHLTGALVPLLWRWFDSRVRDGFG